MERRKRSTERVRDIKLREAKQRKWLIKEGEKGHIYPNSIIPHCHMWSCMVPFIKDAGYKNNFQDDKPTNQVQIKPFGV